MYEADFDRDEMLEDDDLESLANELENWEDDDGQPSSYDEYQDLFGGDDCDFGQFDGEY